MQVNLVFFRPNGGRKVIAVPSIPAVIGRGDDCDVKAPVKGVSRKHCQLLEQSGHLAVKDLKSSNGTYVNGSRVEVGTLDPGDIIKLGDISLSVQIDGKPEDPQPARAAAAAPAAPTKAQAQAPEDIDDILEQSSDSEDSVDDFISMMFEDDDEDKD